MTIIWFLEFWLEIRLFVIWFEKLDYHYSVLDLFSSFTSAQKTETKESLLKTFTMRAEAEWEQIWSNFLIYCVGSYTDLEFYSVDLCVKQD